MNRSRSSRLRRFAALALLALFAICGPATAETPGAVRVVTYNIRLDTAVDGANAWPHRREAVSSLLRFYTPDVIGLQEVQLHQRDQLATDLADYTFLGVGRDDGRDAGEFSPLAFRTDRFQLGEHGVFWLSPTPDRPSRGWDSAYPRLVTWARLRDRRSGRRLLALNTHWDNVGTTARLESARIIADWLHARRRGCENVLVLGDLNATPGEGSYQELTRAGGLIDARTLAETPPFGPSGTFNGFDLQSAAEAPIDHILVGRGARVIRLGVLTQHDAGRLPSDHYPVLADLALPRCPP